MSKRKTVVMDLDGTICTQKTFQDYHLALPIQDVIDKVNKLWMSGWDVIIYTARGMNSLEGNVSLIERQLGPMTEKWLKDNRVCYTKLIFGKYPADVFVDDRGLKPDEFVTADL